MKHTPAPWIVVKDSYDTYVDTADDKHHIADCDGTGMDLSEAQANARLIATAPELLDSLKWLVSLFEKECKQETIGHKAITEAKQAIAKAEGK